MIYKEPQLGDIKIEDVINVSYTEGIQNNSFYFTYHSKGMKVCSF